MTCLLPDCSPYCLRSGACSGYCWWNRLRTSLRLNPYSSENLRALSTDRGTEETASAERERRCLGSIPLFPTASPHSLTCSCVLLLLCGLVSSRCVASASLGPVLVAWSAVVTIWSPVVNSGSCVVAWPLSV